MFFSNYRRLNLDLGFLVLPGMGGRGGKKKKPTTFSSADDNHPNVSQVAVCTICTGSTQLADVQSGANNNCPLIMAATQLVISQVVLVDRVSPPGHRDFLFPLLKSMWFLLASSQGPSGLILYNALSSQCLPFFSPPMYCHLKIH